MTVIDELSHEKRQASALRQLPLKALHETAGSLLTVGSCCSRSMAVIDELSHEKRQASALRQLPLKALHETAGTLLGHCDVERAGR